MDDILRNSSLPDYDALEETQEGDNAESCSTQEGNTVADEANHLGNADSEPGDSPGEPDDNRSDYSKQSEFEREGELDNEYAESVVHVTELTTVMNAADYHSRDADWDFLFDPGDEREGAGDSDGGAVLVPAVHEQADELIP
ncbi:hypothetical protein PI124_g22536 [Phytophthora idaei]|nr:hypothetical protein PI125_g24342 [Phytophthora idaei]KAG3232379.1 hypothetical protein PI124_g22536 [Phytophthora idaei]